MNNLIAFLGGFLLGKYAGTAHPSTICGTTTRPFRRIIHCCRNPSAPVRRNGWTEAAFCIACKPATGSSGGFSIRTAS